MLTLLILMMPSPSVAFKVKCETNFQARAGALSVQYFL
jgi:hypothetical protein